MPWKRVERAIKVLAEVKKSYSKCKLVVVGDGVSRARLEQYAKELAVEDSVVFRGAISHDEVYNYMYSCDVFLSLYDLSNVGNPLFESLYLGCCDVVLDGGDTRLFVEDGVNGIVINKEQINKLPELVLELLENPEKRNVLKKNAAKRAQKELYSWNTRMEMEYDAIQELLK